MASVLDYYNVDWFKDTYLVGVDLTLDDGSPYPDTMYEQALFAALAYVEHELGIKIDPISITDEQHDAYDANRGAYWPFRLDHRPVVSFEGFRLQYGSYEPITMPLGWLQLVSPEHGQVHLIPSSEGLGAYLYRSGVPFILGDVMQPKDYVPGYFRFDYTAGFPSETGDVTFSAGETEKTVTFDSSMPNTEYSVRLTVTPESGTAPPVIAYQKTKAGFKLRMAAQEGDVDVSWFACGAPADLMHVVGLMASMLPLDIAGDLIAGAGIASKSTGVDGLHQSINTTASATNSGFGARVLEYQKEMKLLLPALRAKFKAFNFGVI